LAEADEDRVFISVISIAEIRCGVERMPQGARRDRIEIWMRDDLPVRFGARILPVDLAVAQEWGVVMEKARSCGMSVSVMDAFLAATARTFELTLVTRNPEEFGGLGLRVLDPWVE